jgi:DNA-3-methyladenine glycosylase I
MAAMTKKTRETIPGLMTADDGNDYCAWHAAMPEYHAGEWGRPVADDIRLFEKICLEGFQSGLAWITILRKRENFRAAFDGFDFRRVARYDERDVERLMSNAGIIRNRAKIVSTINNAQRACELVAEAGSLAAWFWQFEPAAKERPKIVTLDYLQANPTSEASANLSGALKKRGWTFVGPTTIHAFMQAMGLVNDHLTGCACRSRIEAERHAFERPGQ